MMQKNKPFLSDKKFMVKNGFKTVDIIDDEYELLAFNGENPYFSKFSKSLRIENNDLTIYYGLQCPYIQNCIREIKSYCDINGIELNLVRVDTLEKAKNMPCVFNNWAVFYKGKFETLHLLNEGYLKKMI